MAELKPLTDEQAMRVVINACDSLNITRLHQVGGPTRTICDEAGLLEIVRAVEKAHGIAGVMADAAPLTDARIEQLAKDAGFGFYGKWLLWQGNTGHLIRFARAVAAHGVVEGYSETFCTGEKAGK